MKPFIAVFHVNATYRNTRAPLQMTPLPENVWEHLNRDFLGPLPDGSYLFVVVDQYSRYPVVEIINSTAAGTVISVLDPIRAAFGNVHAAVTTTPIPE